MGEITSMNQASVWIVLALVGWIACAVVRSWWAWWPARLKQGQGDLRSGRAEWSGERPQPELNARGWPESVNPRGSLRYRVDILALASSGEPSGLAGPQSSDDGSGGRFLMCSVSASSSSSSSSSECGSNCAG